MSNTEYLNDPKFMEHARLLWECKKESEKSKICKCSKCLGEFEYKVRGIDRDFLGGNKVWEFNLGRGGYDSQLDNYDIYFELCDRCLIDFINSFPEETRKKATMHMSTYGMESTL